jgi:RNA polymerase sigma factor (sigma-70 family)
MRTADGYIISKCLNDGDSTAFGLLVDKYKASIYALAYSKLHNFHDAEDVTQEVFVKAYRNLPKLRRWDNFFAWLYSITSNLCKDFLQEKAKFSDSEFIEDQSVDMLKTSSIRSFHDERAFESIREALDSLPEIYQQVLTLHYLGGMTGEEISEFLGVPHPTIRQRLSRARSMLKEEMIAMINTDYEHRRLSANFTFRIIEMVKKIRIHPTSGIKGLPYGLSIGAGIIFAILSFGQYIQINLSDIAMGLPMPSDTKILKVGEIPVDAVRISTIPFIAGKGNGKGVAPEPKGQENAFFMDPQDEGWAKRADMTTTRSALSASTVNGKVYAIGGIDQAWNALLTVEEYDPSIDKWARKADMPTARIWLSASELNGKIYAIGGAPGIWGGDLSAVEEYDPVADKWIKKSDMPTSRTDLCTCAINGRIYAIGGLSGLTAIPTLEEYDPVADKWTRKSDMPTARCSFAAGVVNGRIYAIGGASPTPWDPSLDVVEEYDPVADKWTKKANMPTAKQFFSASVVNEKIYIIGGAPVDHNFLKTVEEYDPVEDKWVKKADMPTARVQLCTSAVNGKIYAIGGLVDNGGNGLDVSTVEEFDTGFISKSVDPSGKLPKTWGMLKAK